MPRDLAHAVLRACWHVTGGANIYLHVRVSAAKATSAKRWTSTAAGGVFFTPMMVIAEQITLRQKANKHISQTVNLPLYLLNAQ